MRWIVLLLLLAPLASAQLPYELELELDELGPVEPFVETVRTLTWTITCAPGATPGIPSPNPGELNLVVESTPTVVISGTLLLLPALPNCASPSQTTGTHELGVAANGDQIAYTKGPINITGVLTWGEVPLEFSVSASTQGTVVTSYRALIEAKTPVKMKQGDPGTSTSFTIEVTNFGNADTYILIESEDPNLVVPAHWPNAPLGHTESAVLTVTYNHPEKGGWNNGQAGLPITLTPVYAQDENQTGSPVQINLLARTRGMPSPALPLLIVGLALLAVRRR